MIYVGTSGYSYDDWVGPFYPEGTTKNGFLDYYAQTFGCVEVNYTYYRMPDARTLAAMAAKTPEGFRFVVKAPGELTHERTTPEASFAQFQAALTPLVESGKLGAVLAQFPGSFRPSDENRDYLAGFRQELGALPVVVEFRHASWVGPRTFDLLRRLDLGFCCVDEPRLRSLMPPFAEVTSDVGYVRFHGRNAAKWFEHEQAWERYNYLYTREELTEWITKTRRIDSRAKETYVFFNNHYNAQAAQNASLFTEMLAEEDR